MLQAEAVLQPATRTPLYHFSTITIMHGPIYIRFYYIAGELFAWAKLVAVLLIKLILILKMNKQSTHRAIIFPFVLILVE